MYPKAVRQLIEQFEKLPGIGPKTAERFVFYFLEKGKGEVERMRMALENLRETIKSCSACQNFADSDPCHICSDKTRDASIVAVVAAPGAVETVEKAGEFKGVYHVLRGVIDSARGITESDIKLEELAGRVQKSGGTIKEIIIALNPDIDGETTALTISRALGNCGVKITKLGRGLPLGSDIEYADEITLGEAFSGRKQVK